MCGIVGYVGTENAAPILIDGGKNQICLFYTTLMLC